MTVLIAPLAGLFPEDFRDFFCRVLGELVGVLKRPVPITICHADPPDDLSGGVVQLDIHLHDVVSPTAIDVMTNRQADHPRPRRSGSDDRQSVLVLQPEKDIVTKLQIFSRHSGFNDFCNAITCIGRRFLNSTASIVKSYIPLPDRRYSRRIICAGFRAGAANKQARTQYAPEPLRGSHAAIFSMSSIDRLSPSCPFGQALSRDSLGRLR